MCRTRPRFMLGTLSRLAGDRDRLEFEHQDQIEEDVIGMLLPFQPNLRMQRVADQLFPRHAHGHQASLLYHFYLDWRQKLGISILQSSDATRHLDEQRAEYLNVASPGYSDMPSAFSLLGRIFTVATLALTRVINPQDLTKTGCRSGLQSESRLTHLKERRNKECILGSERRMQHSSQNLKIIDTTRNRGQS